MLRQNVSTPGPPLAGRVAVFRESPASLRNEGPGGRFPPFDKLDLLEHGPRPACVDYRNGIRTPTERQPERRLSNSR